MSLSEANQYSICTIKRNHIRTHYSERASASDVKDTAASRFGHSDVVLSIFSNKQQKVPPVNHQQKVLNKRSLWYF